MNAKIKSILKVIRVANLIKRLLSYISGITALQTIPNIIKKQDLNNRLSNTTSKNEINMLKKLIQANQSRKLMIEQELEEMRDFSENELQLSSSSLNDREIAEVLESEQYLSYVEKRQKLEEANTLLNQLIQTTMHFLFLILILGMLQPYFQS